MTTSVALYDGKLAYTAEGDGPAIVFITGLSGFGSYWRAQVAHFSSSFRTVTFDHRGVGASSGAPPYNVEQWAVDTLWLMDQLDLDRVHFVGHSTGGAIAQVLAADHPDRVASLVLGGTWARPDERFKRLFEFRKRVLLDMGAEAYDDLGVTLTLPAGLPPANVARLPSRQTPPDIVAARIDALLAYDAGDRLRAIRSPTLVLAAQDDILVPHQLSEALAKEIPGARFATFERGGHHFPQTQAGAYNHLLTGFFRESAEGEIRE
jgi:aminoacrylate hydrolase